MEGRLIFRISGMRLMQTSCCNRRFCDSATGLAGAKDASGAPSATRSVTSSDDGSCGQQQQHRHQTAQ
jgi:hypothetical protein